MPASKDGQVDRRVQGPPILGSTRSASTPRVTSVPAPRPPPWCQATGTRRWVPFPLQPTGVGYGRRRGGSIRLLGVIAVVSLRCCSPVFRQRRVAGPVSPSLSGNGQSRPVTEHRPPAWGQYGVPHMNRESKIDDRVHIPVMLGTARRPSVRPPGLSNGCLFPPQKGRQREVMMWSLRLIPASNYRSHLLQRLAPGNVRSRICFGFTAPHTWPPDTGATMPASSRPCRGSTAPGIS